MKHAIYNKSSLYSSGFRPDSSVAKQYFTAARTKSLELQSEQSNYSAYSPKARYPSQEKSAKVPVRTAKQEQILENLTQRSQEAKVARALTPRDLPVKIVNRANSQPNPAPEQKNVARNLPQVARRSAEQSLSSELKNTKKGISSRKKILGVMSIIFVLSFTVVGLFSNLNISDEQNSNPAVAGAQEIKQNGSPEYISWIIEKNKSYSDTEDDLDSDGLTNEEEFKLETNPISPNSCNPEKTDAQNLFELINPVDCQPINLEDADQFEKFKDILNQSKLLESAEDSQNVAPAEMKMNSEGFLKLFGVSSFDDLEKISVESLKQQGQDSPIKVEYIKKIDRIDKYIKKFRSYEPYDRDEKSPVSPAKYLQVSLEYNTPLKYLIAVARAESRFGTDKYDRSGELSRPGKFKNIYSIGLTSISDKSYSSWDKGVEGFGIWYKRYQDRGVSDCRKWKIYNPNGDYCSKIEKLSREVEDFLNQ